MTEPEELLPQLDLEEHLRDPGIKQRFVTAMFEVVAPRYDRFTRAFSFGMDRGWKRQLLAELDGKVQGNATVLDLASGTGDLALGATMRLPQARALGLDVSRRMVKAAVQRTCDVGNDRVRFSVAHMPHLPVRDTAVDAVTVGYGIRNAPDHGAALDEIARVLRPDGLLLVLDFYRPRNRLWRSLYLWYLRVAGSLYGWLWHRQAVAYGYIAPSIEHYISWQDFSAALEQRGFVVERVSRKLFGGIGIHVACKAESGGGMA
jgi:demethylmenaquinone methyltransferase/2-methoxy-6-polyprenyl-1,4-benzoquinol methylase